MESGSDMFRNLCSAILLSAVLFASSSSGNPAPHSPPGGDLGTGAGVAEPYVVKGRVTDSHGNPLEGIRVFANHTVFYNMNIFAATDADGNYRIELGDIIPSSWLVGAYLEREFHGDTFEYSLHPVEYGAFAGVNGAIRDLEWRLSGKAPEDWHYGGLVTVDAELYDVDTEFVELTLVPVGPLIDGSTGKTISGLLDRGVELADIPVGNYRATARYLPVDGPAQELLVRVRDEGQYAASVTAPLKNNLQLGHLLPLEVRLP